MSPPKVLLIYANPAMTATPVAPYGMERIGAAFAAVGCAVRMCAPFLEADPLQEVQEALGWGPDLVGFSVRNVDDTLVVSSVDGETTIDTEFYLDAVRPLIDAASEQVGADRVVLGGTAIATGPEEVLAYLGGETAIVGPAEDLCAAVGQQLGRGEEPVWPDDPRVVSLHGPAKRRSRGFASAWHAPKGPTPRMRSYLGLILARGGRVAVQLSVGCDRRCTFCIEPRLTGHVVMQRPVDEIVSEITLLKRAGVQRFWLTTSELNVPNDRHAIAVLEALAPLNVDLAAFVQPAPVSDALLDAMESAGMDPEQINYEFGHLDDGILRAGGGPCNRRQVDALVDLYLRRGYRRLGGSILLGAHPDETWQTVDSALDSALEIDRAFDDGLFLAYATGGRVYPQTPLAQWIRQHPREAQPYLYGAADLSSAAVTVFSRPAAPRALMRHVQQRLQHARGQMGPMNVEAQGGAVEGVLNQALLRLGEGNVALAQRLLERARTAAPDHPEVLRQSALLFANHLGDVHRASEVLHRLREILPMTDPRREEVQRALDQLAAHL